MNDLAQKQGKSIVLLCCAPSTSMIGFMEPMYYYSLRGCLCVKAEIISRAGRTDVLLPSLIAEGLSANDRVKARLTILQAVERHARHLNSIWEPSAALLGSTWA